MPKVMPVLKFAHITCCIFLLITTSCSCEKNKLRFSVYAILLCCVLQYSLKELRVCFCASNSVRKNWDGGLTVGFWPKVTCMHTCISWLCASCSSPPSHLWWLKHQNGPLSFCSLKLLFNGFSRLHQHQLLSLTLLGWWECLTRMSQKLLFNKPSSFNCTTER